MALHLGDAGLDVVAVQQGLRKSGSSLLVDSQFGKGTAAAVAGFQAENGLPAHGIVDPKTVEALAAVGQAELMDLVRTGAVREIDMAILEATIHAELLLKLIGSDAVEIVDAAAVFGRSSAASPTTPPGSCGPVCSSASRARAAARAAVRRRRKQLGDTGLTP